MKIKIDITRQEAVNITVHHLARGRYDATVGFRKWRGWLGTYVLCHGLPSPDAIQSYDDAAGHVYLEAADDIVARLYKGVNH